MGPSCAPILSPSAAVLWEPGGHTNSCASSLIVFRSAIIPDSETRNESLLSPSASFCRDMRIKILPCTFHQDHSRAHMSLIMMKSNPRCLMGQPWAEIQVENRKFYTFPILAVIAKRQRNRIKILRRLLLHPDKKRMRVAYSTVATTCRVWAMCRNSVK